MLITLSIFYRDLLIYLFLTILLNYLVKSRDLTPIRVVLFLFFILILLKYLHYYHSYSVSFIKILEDK